MSPMAGGGTGGGIGGDASVVEGGADGVAEAATSITATGQQVRSHGDNLVDGWVGSTSDAAHEVLRWLSERTDVGGEVVSRLPKILDGYASELRAAQEAYATAVAQAVAARAALGRVRALEAESGFVATTPVRPEAFGAAPPSALEAGAIEDVDAASDAIAAAIAREQLANRTAAEGVNTLTGELSAMTLDVMEAQGAAVTEQPRGAEDVEPGSGWSGVIKGIGNGVAGIFATGYLAVQIPEYYTYRAIQMDHDAATTQLEREYQAIVEAGPADTESAAYRFFDLHDDLDHVTGGAPGGGLREVGAATGSAAWDVAYGMGTTNALNSPDPAVRAAGEMLQNSKQGLLEFSGADTDTSVYRGAELTAGIAALIGPPSALRVGRIGGGINQGAQVVEARSTGLEEAGRSATEAAAASVVAREQVQALERAAYQTVGRPGTAVDLPRSAWSADWTAGRPAPEAGRTATPDGLDIADLARSTTEPHRHTWTKHVDRLNEFPGVSSPNALSAIMEDVVRYGDVKQPRPGVYVYYKDGVVAWSNPYAADPGTVFPVKDGHEYFLMQKEGPP